MLFKFTPLRFPYMILCPNLMTVQTCEGKVPHTHKELFKAAAIKVTTK